MASKEYEEISLLTEIPIIKIVSAQSDKTVARMSIQVQYTLADGTPVSTNTFVGLSKKQLRAIHTFIEAQGVL